VPILLSVVVIAVLYVVGKRLSPTPEPEPEEADERW
jgi:hypothetical protein